MHSRDQLPEAHRQAIEQPTPPGAIDSLCQPDDPAERSDDREPEDPGPELEDPDGLEIDNSPDLDEDDWDVFIPDDDERDPLPEPGDFWLEDCAGFGVDGEGAQRPVVTCH